MPYRYLDDIATADVAFEAWGEGLEELFSASAAALLRTMVEEPEGVIRRETVLIRLMQGELDLLLYGFLEELVFYKDARRLLLHPGRLMISTVEGGYRLEGEGCGERIAPERHRLLVDVKAVTLHRFALVREGAIWRATVVLDV